MKFYIIDGRSYTFFNDRLHYASYRIKMNHILLIAATEKEIAPTIHYCDQHHTKEKNIDVLIAGIGLAFTTYHLTKYIQNTKPDLIIQAGIAGSLTNKYNSGDVVLIEKDFFADMGSMENNTFKDVFDLNLCHANDYPFSNKGLINIHKNIMDIFNLPRVIGISVNEITTHQSRIQLYKEKYHADVESMEGAAFHYVCLQQKIPFVQIRSISNMVGVRDKTKWNMKEAIQKLNVLLMDRIERL